MSDTLCPFLSTGHVGTALWFVLLSLKTVEPWCGCFTHANPGFFELGQGQFDFRLVQEGQFLVVRKN